MENVGFGINGTEEQPREEVESAASKTRDLQLEEYKVLTKEIQARMKELGDLERYSLVGILGYYAWLITHSSHGQFPTALWWVPVAVALFIMARTIIYSHRVNIISKHIAKKIEANFGLTDGYETEMQQRLQGRTLDQTYLYHSEHWRSAAGYVTRFVFAYTDDDVAQLNADLRSVRKATGELGEDHEIDTAHGRHAFAVGDRIQFTATDKKQGIVNGAAGTIEAINGTNLEVRLDGREPKTINFDAANFDQFRHGYAGTIYRGQPVAAGQRLQRRIRAAMKNPIWKWSAAVGGSTAFVWLALLAGTISVALCHGALVVAETTPGCE